MPKDLFGFTLVELLVVVAVVGVLSGLVIVVLNPAHFRNQAQDSRRISDLGNIQTTLELSFANNNRYPTAAEFSALTVPTDPDGGSYTYCPAGDNMTFNICTTLEVVDASTVSDCSTGTIAPCSTSYSNSTTSCCLTNPF